MRVQAVAGEGYAMDDLNRFAGDRIMSITTTRGMQEGAGGDSDRKAAEMLDQLGFRVPTMADDADFRDRFSRDGLSDIEETIVSSKRSWDGGFFGVDTVDVELPNGEERTRSIVRHPGAVGIIALDDENRILLVNQYRTALERVTLEIPAGKLEHGEAAEECAQRELEEETGFHAGTLKYFIPYVPAAGYSDEVIHLFLATDLTPGAAQPDDDEFIAVQWMPVADLIDLVLDGQIEDSKTIIAALACDAIARRL